MGIFRFSPGSCRKTCVCTRCTAGRAPRYWTVTILGVNYILYPARQNNLQNCVYEKFQESGLICDAGTHLVLNLGETVTPDYFFSLELRAANGAVLYSYALFGLASVNCRDTFILPKTSGTCIVDSDTATITPGPVATSSCCKCEEGSSGGGGGGPPDNGCCLTMPSAWNLTFPTAVWGNQSCTNCTGVVGVFNLPFLDAPPLVGARYRYFNANWCTDTVVPCVGGTISLEIMLTFTAGCGLRAQFNLDRQLLDHEVCAARCRIGYTANNFTPPRNCVASPITLTANNYPNANPCSSRTAGGPPPSPFDTLCDDFTDGAFPPEFITATAG